MSDGKQSLVFAVLVTAALAGGMAWFQRQRRADLIAGHGELETSFVVRGNKAPVLVALEKITIPDEDNDETVWRLSAWNAATGQLLSRKAEVPWNHCAASGRDTAWCVGADEKLAVVHVPGFEVLHSADDIARKVGQKVMNPGALDTRDGALDVTLADGRKVLIDAEDLVVTPIATAREEPPPRKTPFDGWRTCAVPGTTREGLCSIDRNLTEHRLDKGDGYLGIERIRSAGLTDRYLFTTRTSLDDAVAQLELVALDETFTERLHVKLGPARATLGRVEHLEKDKLLLLSFTHVDSTVAVDLEQGVVRYRIEH